MKDDDVRSFLCLKCCPKCGGALLRECDIQGCDVECLQCGYVMTREKLEAMVGREKAEEILKLGRKPAPVQEEKHKRRRRKTEG